MARRRSRLPPQVYAKTCSRCRRFKLIEEFPRCRSNSDGYYYYCLHCHAEIQRTRRKNNPDEHRASASRWRRKNTAKVRALARGTSRQRRERLGAVVNEEFT